MAGLNEDRDYGWGILTIASMRGLAWLDEDGNWWVVDTLDLGESGDHLETLRIWAAAREAIERRPDLERHHRLLGRPS